jgi:MFS family permease
VLYAGSGLYRLVMLGPEPNYLRDYFPSMLLSGVGVGFVFPQLSSVVAQALPPNRRGVGGAALQAGRQFGGTFGVALTIALLGAATSLTAMMSAFEQIWWLIAIGGLVTALLAIPLHTTETSAVRAGDADDPKPTSNTTLHPRSTDEATVSTD